MGNNPVNFVDPLGLYGEDVHYYKTLDWAIKAGIEPRIAERISAANQRTDDRLWSSPFNVMTGTQLHFTSREFAEAGLKRALLQGSIEWFGFYLHILQDSFSHKGYSWPFGHSIDTAMFGKDPDKYCGKSTRDNEMKKTTIEWLKKFEEQVGKKYHPVIRGL